MLVLLAFLTSVRCEAQFDSMYFSKTGDTILYNGFGIGDVDSDSMTWHMYLLRYNNQGDSLEKISQFEVPTLREETPFHKFNPDTIRKYNLEFNGIRQDSSKHEVYSKIGIKKLRMVGRSMQQEENIYTCKATITIKCKNKIIKRKTIDYMFQGATDEINYQELCSIVYWKKQNADKYFIKYKLLKNSIVTPEGVGTNRTWNTEFAIY